MSDANKTIDPHTLSQLKVEGGGANALPCVEVLYHYDLDFIGRVTPPELFLKGEWIHFGRATPEFCSPLDTTEGFEPLGDPCISRQQLSLRWLAHLGSFEVEVSSQARRQVRAVSLYRRSGMEQTLLPPGTKRVMQVGELLAIEDRALLRLSRRVPRGGEHHRMGMVGEDPLLWQIRDDVQQVARFRGPVLIIGETGVGKELVARAIHHAAPDQRGPLRVVNCGAIAENLVESELFGHKKGAFTGAEGDKKGLFKAAEGGSLFMDEIGELPLQMQQKILRTLQEGTIMPVGSVSEERVDVRVIAATNRDLRAEVAEGRFREDLYYRLTAHVVQIPPLRERRGDIARLFVEFLRHRCQDHPELRRLWRRVDAYAAPVPMGFFLDLLSAPWEGNIRHLQNVAEMTARVNLTHGGFCEPRWRDTFDAATGQTLPAPVEPADEITIPPIEVPESVGGLTAEQEAALSRAGEAMGAARATLLKLLRPGDLERLVDGEDLGRSADRVREYATEVLLEMLERFDFNQTHVANALELSRTTLVRLMQGLGVRRAKELSSEEIMAVWRPGVDVAGLARDLRVSPRALMLRLTDLGMELE